MMLNRLALEARYPDRYPEMKTTDPEIRAYRHSSQAANPYLFLVALECLRYQCSEGVLRKTPLYAEIDRALNHWRGVNQQLLRQCRMPISLRGCPTEKGFPRQVILPLFPTIHEQVSRQNAHQSRVIISHSRFSPCFSFRPVWKALCRLLYRSYLSWWRQVLSFKSNGGPKNYERPGSNLW